MSIDPLSGTIGNPQSLNRYAYVLNDPVNLADPAGMNPSINKVCMLLDNGDSSGFCVGGVGDMMGADPFASVNADPFGAWTDPTHSDPMAEGEARYAQQVGQAFAAGTTGSDGNGNTFTWNGDHWVKDWNGEEITAGAAAELGLGTPSANVFAGGPSGIAANDVTKHYGLTTPCSSTASQVMGAVESNFANFGNYSTGPFSVTFSPPSGLGVGSTIPISVGYFGITQNMAVGVQSMSSQSMTFNTLPGGHLLYPASITFAASPGSGGTISFSIDLTGNFNGSTNAAKYYAGGALLENAQWNHFLAKIKGFCGVGH